MRDASADTGDLWECNSTVGHIQGLYDSQYQNISTFKILDKKARLIAGAIGWSGVLGHTWPENDYSQLNRVIGDYGSPYDVASRATASEVSGLIVKFTIVAIAALDQLKGARMNVTGLAPSPPLVMRVKWSQAASILIGIPAVQLIMLFGVVWYFGKAITLETSYLTAAHLVCPVLQKLAHRGVLMTVDEMTEFMGPEFKIAYTVRPSSDDPGHHNKEFVRDPVLVEESEGFRYIRSRMPEGRYD